MTFKAGLFVGFALIIAIGAQNIFVIKQGLQRQYAYTCALVCALCDAFLISISVLGVYHVISHLAVLQFILLLGAGVFLVYYGSASLYRAWQQKVNVNFSGEASRSNSLKAIILFSLGFSLLNPQAILDCVVILGGYASHYSTLSQSLWFGVGAVIASCIWFFGLSFLARYCSRFLKHPTVWRGVEALSGFIMLLIASQCLFQLFYFK
jgi:L-lysine exporter family protein LysE/ArgO